MMADASPLPLYSSLVLPISTTHILITFHLKCLQMHVKVNGAESLQHQLAIRVPLHLALACSCAMKCLCPISLLFVVLGAQIMLSHPTRSLTCMQSHPQPEPTQLA